MPNANLGGVCDRGRTCARLALLLVAAGAMAVSPLNGQSVLVDLTQKAESEVRIDVERMIDIRPSHHTGPWPPPGRVYQLPLALRIETVTPVPDVPRQWVVEFQIYNTGDDSFYLPVSMDPGRSVMQSGNLGRRLFWFSPQIRSPGERPISAGTKTTDGSESVPESVLEIRPQESVMVRMLANGGSRLWEWSQRGIAEVELVVGIGEETLSDDRFFVESSVKWVFSDNTVEISIEPLN